MLDASRYNSAETFPTHTQKAHNMASNSHSDFLVVGGGIVGLATAWRLSQQFPDARIRVLEKEPQVCSHQSGRNSGVLHSGIYYKPGSLKATLVAQAKQRSSSSVPNTQYASNDMWQDYCRRR